MLLNDILEITAINWRPQRNDEVEGLGSGQILQANLATPLWAADVVTPLTEFRDGRRLRAIINNHMGPGRFFDIYDPIGGYPAADPDGSILGAATVTVSSVLDGKIALTGLPVGYELSIGDYFTVAYGSPLRRGFFEIASDVTANGSGTTPLIDINPFSLSGITAGSAVNLIKPMLKAQFLPGSVQHPEADSSVWKMQGFRFTVVQKL